ncbi:hypothetical protein OSB04_001087 [Centaurea solstitialis]|uniref:Uncharacterized protein n=1 Tax=Centaurea solstitialis TaxID=347529 RepID=A0AA38U0X1_9ASTR|nr:hypothetical protein OSB04_001087 [Centaurea solstitialis]
MIREDEGFSHYPFDPTAVLPSEVETTISEEERANNVKFVKNRERHANHRADLSQHFYGWRQGSGKVLVPVATPSRMNWYQLSSKKIDIAMPIGMRLKTTVDELIMISKVQCFKNRFFSRTGVMAGSRFNPVLSV